jgi:hypothetical protein
VDVKATAVDIKGAGQNANLTSYAKIRDQYLADPNYIFMVLALEHTVRSYVLVDGKIESIMKVASCQVFDLKSLAARDVSLNPALGHGQLQIRDIQNMDSECVRTTADFCALLDAQFLARNGEAKLQKLALKKGWLAVDEMAIELPAEEAESPSI